MCKIRIFIEIFHLCIRYAFSSRYCWSSYDPVCFPCLPQFNSIVGLNLHTIYPHYLRILSQKNYLRHSATRDEPLSFTAIYSLKCRSALSHRCPINEQLFRAITNRKQAHVLHTANIKHAAIKRLTTLTRIARCKVPGCYVLCIHVEKCTACIERFGLLI